LDSLGLGDIADTIDSGGGLSDEQLADWTQKADEMMQRGDEIASAFETDVLPDLNDLDSMVNDLENMPGFEEFVEKYQDIDIEFGTDAEKDFVANLSDEEKQLFEKSKECILKMHEALAKTLPALEEAADMMQDTLNLVKDLNDTVASNK
jgi:hypothetical protein